MRLNCVWCIVCHSINQPGDLDLWPLTSKYVPRLPSCQFRASYAFPFSRVDGGTRQTDRETDIHRPLFHNSLSMQRSGIIILTMILVFINRPAFFLSSPKIKASTISDSDLWTLIHYWHKITFLLSQFHLLLLLLLLLLHYLNRVKLKICIRSTRL